MQNYLAEQDMSVKADALNANKIQNKLFFFYF